jgi:FixJ family two-component response regulator
MNTSAKKGMIYIVDDDEAVRDSLQWLLEGQDYRVRCFDSAESFLGRYDPREVACLIADVRMDGMSGLELQDRLIERQSPLPIIFITGHGDVPMAVDAMKKGALDAERGTGPIRSLEPSSDTGCFVVKADHA